MLAAARTASSTTWVCPLLLPLQAWRKDPGKCGGRGTLQVLVSECQHCRCMPVGCHLLTVVLADCKEGMAACLHTGHFAGLLTGLYLGWGLAPSVPPAGAALPPGAPCDGTGKPGGGSPAPHPGPPPQPDLPKPAVLDELRRWAGYTAFAASLGLVTAAAVVARTGQLPLPKGPDLAGFLGQGLV